VLASYVKQLRLIFTKEGMRQVGGFGTIGSLFPASWDWLSFWTTTAFLSLILAFMNILPIPALDGGHVLFLLYEMVTGRKPSEKFLEHAQLIGMILLIALLLYANGNDIFRWLSE
jgi:regulator of sigma E protease